MRFTASHNTFFKGTLTDNSQNLSLIDISILRGCKMHQLEQHIVNVQCHCFFCHFHLLHFVIQQIHTCHNFSRIILFYRCQKNIKTLFTQNNSLLFNLNFIFIIINFFFLTKSLKGAKHTCCTIRICYSGNIYYFFPNQHNNRHLNHTF